MDRIKIQGGIPLKGVVKIGGAKNAALPLMVASLLTDDVLILKNLPHLADIASMINLLAELGVNFHFEGDQEDDGGYDGRILHLDAKKLTSHTAPYELVRKMRASVWVLGPLVARLGEARVSLPGGCAIGTRPIDLHLEGLKKLGAEIDLEGGYVVAKAPHGLKGAEIVFPKISVGATANVMMAACLAKGETVLINAAREPEISDLAECLNKMGAEITGIGTDRIHIVGKERLHGATHAIIADRIELGTYAIAAAITKGDLELVGGGLSLIESAGEILKKAGVEISTTNRGIRVQGNDRLIGVDVMTEPFPGFPTDLQAQLMALMCVANGASMVTETIFENRFMHVPELVRMGANINVHGSSAMIRGTPKLIGAPVMATDLRASVSLILAGLSAEGETEVSRVYHLDRGYERLEEKLQACGALIQRVR